eukprot:CAMPEP_0170554776 /NCGR_PEP_ID=MMETSP0211-20121228/12653_1 /TAXON_ID=311385 /ORGANISM="Pseudokeronopsis sp., Strain OXSARD2" /LENGTH=54 /DNA_ID=CAMNT_0010864115 /DNA_START=455 /DNA_END=616 /DNA_ORIENTATION=+
MVFEMCEFLIEHLAELEDACFQHKHEVQVETVQIYHGDVGFQVEHILSALLVHH